MVDTYDYTQGVTNAIIVAKELKEKGLSLYGIMIDSGDLLELCIQARKMLDEEGFHDVKITLASNLDEYKIQELNRKRIPADAFLIATEVITVPDAPKLETVYKLAELRSQDQIHYCAKFAHGKESYPGRKQVFRIKRDGVMEKDIIGLEDENPGEPLLIEIIKDGKLIAELSDLDSIKQFIKMQLDQLPKNLLELGVQHNFTVEMSPKLKALFNQVKEEHHPSL